MGKVILIGAGPGDTGLLTLKGKSSIEKADCIVYDRLIGSNVLDFARPDCDMVYAGKENHNHVLTQDEINEVLYQKALVYPLVVRVKGGDPYVFGRGGEEALYLLERGIECEVVPGVSSFIAALTDAGIPITHRSVARSFQIMTAHGKEDDPLDLHYEQLCDTEKTCVFMMGLSHLEEIAKGLMAAGRSEDTPVAVISNGTRYNQRKCVGTLSDIAGLVREAKLPSPAVIAVGDVIKLNDTLNFFEKRPLFGKSFFMPYLEGISFSFSEGLRKSPSPAIIEELKEKGANVVSIPLGRIKALSCSTDAGNADVIIFTSKNAVYAYMWNLKCEGKDIRAFGKAKIAAVGSKTAEALASFGLCADFLPEKETGKDLAQLLLEHSAGGSAVWFCAEETSEGLGEALSGKWTLDKRPCYRNEEIAVSSDSTELKDALKCDCGVFTSASGAKRAAEALGGKLPPVCYSIGPSCSEALRSLHANEIKEAAAHNYEGILAII